MAELALLASERFAFHAGPLAGGFINDPNGLVHAGGRWRLFVQHRDDPPAFERTGWARFSSDDLLHWDWDGPVIPPDAEGWAWSGSVRAVEGGRLEAIYTRHAAPPAPPWEVQRRALSEDAGLTWRAAPLSGAPEGRNARDPFVFAGPDGGLRMLIARPCGWTGWEADAPSSIETLSSTNGERWASVGTIGPWAEPGVMWEVPLLLPFGETWALIVAVTDRRPGRAGEGGVRYWLGVFDDARFAPEPEQPEEGRSLDLGPDFQVGMIAPEDAPGGERLMVGWASNWTVARRVAWPGGGMGGQISLPRRLSLDPGSRRLRQAPVDGADGLETLDRTCKGGEPFSLTLTRGGSSLRVQARPLEAAVQVERTGRDPALNWSKRHPDVLSDAGIHTVRVFVDGPLIEVFIAPEGLTVTASLDGDGPVAARWEPCRTDRLEAAA